VSENGATPELEWQPAHFAAKTGATSLQVGEPAVREADARVTAAMIAAAHPRTTAIARRRGTRKR
jgi:hypothetical protein